MPSMVIIDRTDPGDVRIHVIRNARWSPVVEAERYWNRHHADMGDFDRQGVIRIGEQDWPLIQVITTERLTVEDIG